jgi:hypothetical protein
MSAKAAVWHLITDLCPQPGIFQRRAAALAIPKSPEYAPAAASRPAACAGAGTPGKYLNEAFRRNPGSIRDTLGGGKALGLGAIACRAVDPAFSVN